MNTLVFGIHKDRRKQFSIHSGPNNDLFMSYLCTYTYFAFNLIISLKHSHTTKAESISVTYEI